MYRVITAEEARDAIAAFDDFAISLDDFYRCRLCGQDAATFNPLSVRRTPLDLVLPPIVRR